MPDGISDLPDKVQAAFVLRLSHWLRIAAVALSVLLVLLFLDTAFHRLRYPYELEELEGSLFLFVRRVFLGGSVYVKPSMEFMPYMYPPGYYYAAAAMAHLTGMTMVALRLTSIVSTLGCCGAIYALVYREVRVHAAAIAAAGLYAGCYTVCEAWFDLGRLDSFFVFTVLVAMYATRNWHPVVAGLFWIVAVQTKQSVLPAAVLMLCYTGRDWRRTIPGIATLGIGTAVIMAWLNHASHGWYRFYVFQVPKANADIKLRSLVLFPAQYILRPCGIAILVIVAAALWTRPRWATLPARFYLAACSLIPLFCWIAGHAGSTVNVGMPIYALTAVLFGIAVGRLIQMLPNLEPQYTGAAAALLFLAVCTQLATGLYNPGDVTAGMLGVRPGLDGVVAGIRAMPGRVFVAQHPYYAYLAGKEPSADLVSLQDSSRVAGPSHQALVSDARHALDGSEFDAIVLNSPGDLGTIDADLGGWTGWRDHYCKPVAILPVPGGLLPLWVMAHDGTGSCQPISKGATDRTTR